MPLHETARYINTRQFTAYGFPIGGFIEGVTRISRDPETVKGVLAAREALSRRGLVILDYHNSLADIVVAAINVTQNLGLTNVIAPFAAKHLRGKLVGHLGKQVEKTGADISRVFREDEVRMVHTEYKGDYQKAFGVTKEQAREENRAFAQRAERAVHEPRSAIIVAPFGTRQKNLTPESLIAREVTSLLQSGAAAVCTYADPRKTPPFYRVFFSTSIMSFGPNDSRAELTAAIREEFQTLKDRARKP